MTNEPHDDTSTGLGLPVSATGQDLVDELVASGGLDGLFDQIDAGEVQLTGAGGFLPGLIKAVLERGLAAELGDHLGYEKGDPAGRNGGNSRNGTTSKTVATEIGDVTIDTPRDRDGTFQPRLVPKGARRVGGLDEMIISLYAGGMTIRDIQAHLERTIGTELSHETIANITDAVLDEITEWQHRPLDEIYPIIYLDALVVKVREDRRVTNKSAYIAVGVDTDGIKHVLGIWVQTTEGAKFWAQVCAELANRGVRDTLIVCCDGLKGFPEAIEATWPHAAVQTCVVHLIRAAMRFVSYKDRKPMAAALKTIYTAPSVEAAEAAFLEFSESDLAGRYPAAVKTWQDAWERFIPFLDFPPAVRKIVYTTNAIESLNNDNPKIIKKRGPIPTDDAVIKLIWLAIIDIEDKRARQRAKEARKPRNERRAPAKLVEGAATHGWNQALNALILAYPDRLAPYINQ